MRSTYSRYIVSTLWLIIYIHSGSSLDKVFSAYTTEAFFLTINDGQFGETINSPDPFEFIPTIKGFPDLPNWINYRFPNGSKFAYLYGTPKSPGNFTIEVIAINKRSYDTYQDTIRIQVSPRENLALYELQFKLTNLNLENIFNQERLTELLTIYRDLLWKESKDIYFTKIVSPRDLGGQLPASPKEKEGVIIRIGSTNNFSRDLLDLEREVEPIKNRDPCPSRYKFTRFEHFFRNKKFFCDWCSFKMIKEPIVHQIDDIILINLDNNITLSPIRPIWPDNETILIPMSIISFNYRNYQDDLLYCIYIPLGVCLIVAILLLPMLFTKDTIDPVELIEPELTKYKSIERATSQLRELPYPQLTKSSPLQSTVSTLPRMKPPVINNQSFNYSSLPRLEHRKQSTISVQVSLV